MAGACIMAATLMFQTAGCTEPPTTTADEVVDYVRNGVAGAKVRRLDPNAQQYVDQLFAAYREAQKSLAPVQSLAEPAALWKADSPNWQSSEREEFQAKIDKWLTDEAREERAQAISALEDAIEKFPPSLAVDVDVYTKEIAELMQPAGDESELEPIARQYAELLTLVSENQDKLVPDEGLRFSDEALSSGGHREHERLKTMLTEYYGDDLDDTQARIKELETVRDELIDEKKALRSSAVMSKEELRRFRHLELIVDYYDVKIKGLEDKAKVLRKAVEPKAEEGSR